MTESHKKQRKQCPEYDFYHPIPFAINNNFNFIDFRFS